MISIELAVLIAALSFVVGIPIGITLELWAQAPKRTGQDDLSAALRELADARDAALHASRRPVERGGYR